MRLINISLFVKIIYNEEGYRTEDEMELHNIMEDVVSDYIEEVLSQKKDICSCAQCKTDMACYTLNKVQPMYVVSSRGIIHTENKRRLNFQDDIDIFSIVLESVEVISKTKRHDINFSIPEIDIVSEFKVGNDDLIRSKYFFNFPQIVGRVLDSGTLSPLDNVEIVLNYNISDENVKMFNGNWRNPLLLVPQMEGVFSFWPAPMIGEKEGIQKDVQLNIRINKSGYEEIRRYFEIRSISTNELTKIIKKGKIYRLDDIYLYPEGLGEEDRQ
jgi:competence protein ComFB